MMTPDLGGEEIIRMPQNVNIMGIFSTVVGEIVVDIDTVLVERAPGLVIENDEYFDAPFGELVDDVVEPVSTGLFK